MEVLLVNTFRSGSIGLPEDISMKILFPDIYMTVTAEMAKSSVYETFRIILEGIK